MRTQHVEDRRCTPDAGLAAGWWAAGLNLRERLRNGPPDSVPSELDQLASRRLARWREAHGLGGSGQFRRRLAAAGLTERRLAALLVEPPSALAARIPRPAWAATVEDILAGLPADPGDAAPAPSRAAGFRTVVDPFHAYGLRCLRHRLADSGVEKHVDLAAVGTAMAERLARLLESIAARTLVLELDVCRVTGRLDGETGDRPLASFVRQFRHPAQLAALCAEYPVLARLLVETAERFAAAAAELLLRFRADRPAIVSELLAGVDPGPLTGVETGGNTHHGGRAVAVLGFASGARVVYKPRSLAVHRHFNDVLEWFNGQLPGLALTRLAVLDREGYGWLEFAAHRPCADRAAVARFHRRQGALLALLYMLGGADFHDENLIARGDQPVLIDPEAVLHPRLPIAGPAWLAADPARLALASSLNRAAVAPVAGEAGARHRPVVDGVVADPADYLDQLLTGFRDGYRGLAAARDDLLKSGGLLWRFAGDEIRVVPRDTRTYAGLLDESTHPDVLRDGLDRDRALDRLWAVSIDAPALERLADAEIAELWRGDVPLFTGRPKNRDLHTGQGVRVPDVLADASLIAAVRKIRALRAADLERQEWVIRAALPGRRAASPPPPLRPPVPIVPQAPPSPPPMLAAPGPAAPAAALRRPVLSGPQWAGGDAPVDPDRLVVAARRIAVRLEHAGYADRERINWLGMTLGDGEAWLLQPMGHGLWQGNGGVALFLAQLAEVTGEERFAALCRRVLTPVPDIVDTLVRHGRITGGGAGGVAGTAGLDGTAGLAYVLTSVAASLADPGPAEPVDELLGLVGKAVGGDDARGIFDGAAGCLAACLAIADATGSNRAMETAELVARQLSRTAPVAAAGPAGPSGGGFGRGPAGIGWALLRYAAVAGDDVCRAAGIAAFARAAEDSGGTVDRATRVPGPERAAPRTAAPAGSRGPAARGWFSGTAGAALARLDALRYAGDDPVVRGELDQAVAAEVLGDPLPDHSLYQGELGVLELLRHRPEAAGALARRTRLLLGMLDRGDVRCATPGVPTPGLLSGLAGIGQGLLCLARPARIRSVLLLPPPGSPAPPGSPE